jgi:outer membrane protein OmpA-like peptidoglycan-associated protein
LKRKELRLHMKGRKAMRIVHLTLIALLACPPLALAEDVPTPEEILKGLKNSIAVESKTIEPKTSAIPAAQSAPVPDISNAGINFVINFDYDSAAIRPDSLSTLINLGKALSDPSFKGQTFLVAGHTDAKGSREYNQQLSQRRSEAVRDFLASAFNIDKSRLIALGFGKDQLKNPADPEGGENRRVQVARITQ